MSRPTGCGVLCYAHQAEGVFLLLGKERETPGWPQGSNKWSAFTGKIEHGESLAAGAAREFLEESCASVALDGSDVAPRVADVVEILETLDVVDRVIETPHETALHRTYLLPLPFAPYPESFASRRRALMDLDLILGRYYLLRKSSTRVPRLFLPGFEAGDLVVTHFSLSDGDVVTELRSDVERVHLRFAASAAVAADVAALRVAWDEAIACLDEDNPLLAHPAVYVQRRHGAIVSAHVDKAFLEKCELAWWPLNEVRRLVAEGEAQDFREGFIEILAKARLGERAYPTQ